MFTRYRQCLYALVEVKPKMTTFKLRKKVTKINLKRTAKPYAHIQILTKHLQSFKKTRLTLWEELLSKQWRHFVKDSQRGRQTEGLAHRVK